MSTKVTEIVSQLEKLGRESYKRILMNHGACEPILGVKISELKKFQKQLKRDYQLALDLYETGIYDAQYLAGLIADDVRMTKRDLCHWVAKGNCAAICGTVVAWVAAESRFGQELAMSWIDSKNECTAQTGWMTLCGLVALKCDAELDLRSYEQLLKRVEQSIHQQPNKVRYAMNTFVISLGSYVSSLTTHAIEAANRIGPVTVDMGNTACVVPAAAQYIQKVQTQGIIGRKRKTVKC